MLQYYSTLMTQSLLITSHQLGALLGTVQLLDTSDPEGKPQVCITVGKNFVFCLRTNFKLIQIPIAYFIQTKLRVQGIICDLLTD